MKLYSRTYWIINAFQWTKISEKNNWQIPKLTSSDFCNNNLNRQKYMPIISYWAWETENERAYFHCDKFNCTLTSNIHPFAEKCKNASCCCERTAFAYIDRRTQPDIYQTYRPNKIAHFDLSFNPPVQFLCSKETKKVPGYNETHNLTSNRMFHKMARKGVVG